MGRRLCNGNHTVKHSLSGSDRLECDHVQPLPSLLNVLNRILDSVESDRDETGEREAAKEEEEDEEKERERGEGKMETQAPSLFDPSLPSTLPTCSTPFIIAASNVG